MNRKRTTLDNCDKKATGLSGRAGRAVPVIGLAGGIGSGKSLVAKELSQMGCVVIDADKLAKQKRDLPQTRKALRKAFGEGIFSDDGQIDEKALAELVFDPEGLAGSRSALARLNEIVHPLVADKCKELIGQYRAQKGLKAVILDAPLLFEAGLERCCDGVIFVQADSARRLQRVQAQRGWTKSKWFRREESQIPLDKKRQISDYTLDNDSSISDLRAHLRKLFPRILGSSSRVQGRVWTPEARSGRVGAGRSPQDRTLKVQESWGLGKERKKNEGQ